MQNSSECQTTITKKDKLLSFAFAWLLLLSIIPSFISTGKLLFQIVSTIVLSSLISYAAYKVENGSRIIALAFNYFLAFWVLFAFCRQTLLQIQNYTNGGSFRGWINFFYYDKSMTIGIVWLTILVVFTALGSKNIQYRNKKAAMDYTSFFNTTSRGFIIFYLLLLLYSFVIIRGFDAHYSAPNFIPFRMIIEYARIRDYRMFMIFFGNLLLFTPFGFYTKVITHKSRFSEVLMPVIISSVIELSQLLFKNGNCDLDDVILNSAGFYLGILIKLSADKIICKKSAGAEKTMFEWLPYPLFNLSLR